MGNGVGRATLKIFRNPLSPSVEQDLKKKKKQAKGRRWPQPPTPAVKKQEAKKLVSVQFENFGIVQDINPKETSETLSDGTQPQQPKHYLSLDKWLQVPPSHYPSSPRPCTGKQNAAA